MLTETQSKTDHVEDAYPLSSLQQGMLFHSLLAPGTGVYIEQCLCDLHETIDETALRQAWATVIGRHPVLRTDFRWADLDEPQQLVHARFEVPWETLDWQGSLDAEQERQLTDLLEADRRRGFDMARAPLLRLTLLRCCETKSRLIWTFHHAVLDGRSWGTILREVFACYDGFRAGTEPTPPMLPRPYRDYINWLQELDFSRSEAFWRRALGGFTEYTPLLADHMPTAVRRNEVGQGNQQTRLSTEATSALQSFADENQLTLNTMVQGAWSLLLSRYSGESEVVFGVTRACRRSTIEGAEAMIGLLINSLPMRVRVRPEAPLISWLRELRAQSVAIREHEHTPLEKVQGWSDVPAGRPLFQTLLVFENFHLSSLLRMQGGPWSNRQFHFFQQTNYPVVLAAYAGAELCLEIGFDRSRLDDATVGRMLGHLRTLLEAMVTKPQKRLRDLPTLTPAEHKQLLVDRNQTEADYPANLPIHQLFEAQVERTPDAIAVIFDERHLTYRELNDRSNQLAHYLQKLGVGPEVLVGLCMDRSPELIVGLLGIFKAGGAYVPIDPGYPAERIAFILNDANAPVVLTRRDLIGALPPLKTTNLVCLDSPECSIANSGNLDSVATNTNLAYVIYTSGSTGKPKGVMISHRSIVNVILGLQSAFPLDKTDRVLHHISISFDPSLLEILAPLIVGGQLVLARPSSHQDPAHLVRTMVQRKVTILHVVPSMLSLLLETPEIFTCYSLRHVFCGGDVLDVRVARRFYEVLNAKLHCVYGPTEAAITSVYYSIPRDHCEDFIPIGRPVSNTQAHVLDRHRQLAPIGVPGELYLGGVQVSRGYHNQPELTKERFITDPFNKTSEARLYKTGDLVRRLPNGNLQFLGRTDQQVKFRGYRIELGEIESVMRLHAAVQESIAVMREDAAGDKRLVAYVKTASFYPALVGELRSILEERLPTYMVPSHFVFLDSFPMTPSGKLDRKALPPPDARSSKSDGFESHVQPRTRTEEVLVGIWRELLKVESEIGVHDNFFELGGHSLTVVRVINRINQAFGLSLGVLELFQNPTVEKLARVIAAQESISERHTRVVHQFQQGEVEPAVYFIYAGPDEFRIAELMGGRHPTFGIQVPFPTAWREAAANNRTAAFPSMEQLVAPFVEALSSHMRFSSCVLAGHSFAGLMAFEAAHQFQRQGGKVDMVMLFDTLARHPTAREVVWHKWRQDWKQIPKGPVDKLTFTFDWIFTNSWLATQRMLKQGAAIRSLQPKASELAPTTILDEQGLPVPFALLERLYKNITKSYCPRRLDSRGVLFRSEPLTLTGEYSRERLSRALDDSLGWKHLFAEGLEVIPVPGDHLSMIRQPHWALAHQMNEMLKRYWTHADR